MRSIRSKLTPTHLLLALLLCAAAAGTTQAAGVVKRALFAKRAGNAQKVGGIRAARTPKAGRLLALDKNRKFPASVLPASTRGPQGVKGDKGDKGAKGDTGPQGPGAKSLSWNSTGNNATDYDTVATVAGITISARCAGTPGHVELALSGPNLLVSTDTLLTDYVGATPDPAVANSKIESFTASPDPVNVLTVTNQGGKTRRVVHYQAQLEREDKQTVDIDATLWAEPGDAFHLCHMSGVATPTS